MASQALDTPSDFDDADRGLIGRLEPAVVTSDSGRVVWDNDAYGFLQVLQSGFGINLPRYSNPRYDEILERAAGLGDAGARRRLLEEAESTMLRDQPLIPLFFYVSKHLVNGRVRGWQDNTLNVVYSKNLAIPGQHAAN